MAKRDDATAVVMNFSLVLRVAMEHDHQTGVPHDEVDDLVGPGKK
jgi:hypothetical protein